MKKSYSHLVALALTALTFSSCSRANYATNPPATPLTTASVAQAPVVPLPAAELSATVVAARQPEAAVAPAAAPIATPTVARRVATAPAPVAAPAASAIAADLPAAKAARPSLGQRLLLKKVTKQLVKVQARQQNAASTEQTAAHGGSLTILLVGLVALLVGIIVSSGFLVTVGSIVAVIGLIQLLLKAL